MKTQELLDAQHWAKATFEPCQLNDLRRTNRAVQVAQRMAECPSGSLPRQMQTWKEVIALYRLLDTPEVTFEALMQPHWQHTRQEIAAHSLVLLVQDTTELDLTPHPKTTGLGQVGNERGRGLYLQTMLAVLPESGAVLGCAQQEPFVRVSAPPGERRSQRRFRSERETDVWMRLVQRLGGLAPETTLVHVGDRTADMVDFFQACGSCQTHFLVRAVQNRRTQTPDGQILSLLEQVRAWPSQGQRCFAVPASHGRKARSTQLQIAWDGLRVLPPRNEPRASHEPQLVWAIRVWEAQPPEGAEPLEWILLTSVPTTSLAHAWERVGWYERRWVVEDYHQCLKTGCRIEARQVRTAERVIRLLGLLAPLAVRLVQLRDLARRAPDTPAAQVVEADLLALVAAQAHHPPSQMTTADFWREVARLGGYLARRRDGPPGWKTLWQGWLHVQTLLDGVHLAAQLRW